MSYMQINIVVETSLLLSECLNPSLDADNPTLISDKYLYMVITQNRKKIVGLKKAKLSFEKASIDKLMFNAISENSNFDNQVILYDFKNYKKKRILEPLSILTSEIETIIPVSFNPFETSVVTQVCNITGCTVLNLGKDSYGVRFAVFEDFNAAGYFEFPLSLSVQ